MLWGHHRGEYHTARGVANCCLALHFGESSSFRSSRSCSRLGFDGRLSGLIRGNQQFPLVQVREPFCHRGAQGRWRPLSQSLLRRNSVRRPFRSEFVEAVVFGCGTPADALAEFLGVQHLLLAWEAGDEFQQEFRGATCRQPKPDPLGRGLVAILPRRNGHQGFDDRPVLAALVFLPARGRGRSGVETPFRHRPPLPCGVARALQSRANRGARQRKWTACPRANTSGLNRAA